MFKNAIIRKPSKSMVGGLSDADLGKPNYEKAHLQHQDYVLALLECGLDVTILDPIEELPDSCFVEDTALLTLPCAILTNPGAPTRKGEVIFNKDVINKFYDQIEHIEPPATVEAGDVMMVQNHFYIGQSARTNHAGAVQLIGILERYGMTGSIVTLSEVLHLKTGLSYLENNNLLATGEFLTKPEFQQFNIIKIPESDAYSANCVWVNGTVLVPAGFPNTSKLIADAGYQVREVDVSEYQKIDGGLSCLSLRF